MRVEKIRKNTTSSVIISEELNLVISINRKLFITIGHLYTLFLTPSQPSASD